MRKRPVQSMNFSNLCSEQIKLFWRSPWVDRSVDQLKAALRTCWNAGEKNMK